jgi:antitoxin ParD1/3/4
MPEPAAITMNVSLPEPLKRYVDARVSSGLYGSASEFVREAIREKLLREQERERADAILASKLIEGLDSGQAIPFTDEYIGKKKSAFLDRLRTTSPQP